MATTSNFGWTTPDDTDLVKDGALAIRTLGNNIDTSLLDLKGGTTGQILSKNSNTDLDYTWINNDQGDITEVQAGTGISVASGTGPVPVITNTVATEFDAKGDLVVGTGADTFDKLTVGNNNDVLTVDSSTATGLKWAAPAASSPLTTKGDLYTYDTGNARLGVGNSGETLLADSSTSTGLRWQGDYAAGKNKIINGDFGINQRSFTSTTTNNVYGFDRFFLQASDGTTTWTAETFTPGASPVAGYEGTNYSRIVSTGQTLSSAQSRIRQHIEDVRTFAGQTVTVSFWAKAATGTPNIVPSFAQVFGSGGSANVLTGGTKQAITTSWVRYSFTVSIPSVSGKTIGTSNYLSLSLYVSAGSDSNASTDSLGIQSNTFDIWGVQVEAGSVATAFQTATGTLQGELALCRRYLPAITGGTASAAYSLLGYAYNTNQTVYNFYFDVPARVAPTGITVSGTHQGYVGNSGTNVTPTFSCASVNTAQVLATSGLTITTGAGTRLESASAGATILFTGCEL